MSPPNNKIPQNYRTRYSLIERALSDDDSKAWDSLLTHYQAFMRQLIEPYGLDKGDEDDIIQTVMIQVTKRLTRYNRDKMLFRHWLAKLVQEVTLRHLEEEATGRERIQELATHPMFTIGEDISSHFTDYINEEWKAYIVDTAIKRASRHFRGGAVQVLKYTLQGKKADEIMELTGFTRNTIYTHRLRVKKHFEEEVRNLMRQLDFESP